MSAEMAPAPEPFYLAGLNDAQREAVLSIDGPVLVLAGAGTGKTRVLTTRLTHILSTGRAFPSQILAVTFTNKAAQEMRTRVATLLNQPVEGWWLGTFHAIAARMLRQHADLVGLNSSFTILDEDDQIRLFKQIAEARNLDVKRCPPKLMSSIVSRWKDRGLTPSDLSAKEAGDLADGRMIDIYKQYQDRLKTLNACDFGDLLLHLISIFKNPAHVDIIASYHKRFRFILVDEYQDTNSAQYLWLRLLARGANNICCVGDDDQSIYGWRGAEVGNILRFERDFPGAKIIRLEENYRSTGHILKAASSVIANNKNRLGKTLWSQADLGEKIQVRGLWDGDAEARYIGEEIEALQHKNHTLNQFAVLVRAGFQMREFEDRFLQLGLNYRVIGGPRFYERAEIRDTLAYLRVIAQPADDLALERILNVPKRGIGDSSLEKMQVHARAQSKSLFDTIHDLLTSDELKGRAKAGLDQLMRDFSRWQIDKTIMSHQELCAKVLDESGYTAMWQADKSADAPGRLENLKELVSAMADYESLESFLEHVSLVLENNSSQTGEAITLMTLHGAKGLEFDVVFLPGWEDGLFPSQRTMDENGITGLEEERRLAYVGLTRARKRAYISYVANRRTYGNWVQAIPSRFVDELPEDSILQKQEAGSVFASGRSGHWDSSGTFGPARLGSEKTVKKGNFKAGDRVSHELFGEGSIIYIDGNKLDISFDKAGNKRVIETFVEKI